MIETGADAGFAADLPDRFVEHIVAGAVCEEIEPVFIAGENGGNELVVRDEYRFFGLAGQYADASVDEIGRAERGKVGITQGGAAADHEQVAHLPFPGRKAVAVHQLLDFGGV